MRLSLVALVLALIGCASQPEQREQPKQKERPPQSKSHPPTFSGPAETELQTSFDDGWKRVTQVLALENIAVTTNNKQAGILQGAGSFAGRPEFFSCRKGKGTLDKEEFTVTVVVSPGVPGATKIQVQATGKTTWHEQNSVFIVHYGHIVNYGTCESTGELEALLLKRIQGH